MRVERCIVGHRHTRPPFLKSFSNTHSATTGYDIPNIPDSITDPAVRGFLERYHEVSNEAELQDDLADHFTPDGECYMNNKINKGRDREFNTLRPMIPQCHLLPSK